MLGDYGCDDLTWLAEHSDRPGTVRVEAHGREWHLPLGRFDNRTDRTSFVRGDPAGWRAEDVDALHSALRRAFGPLSRS